MEEKSKSQVKREMTALQVLGKQLVELTSNQIGKIEMPTDLLEAVLFAKTLKRGEALRRQMQYIGVLMRETDPEPIRKVLDEIGRGHGSDARRLRELEQWRDELINGNDELLQNILDRFPGADHQRVRKLVTNARKERELNKPPKSSRSLFRYLRDIPKDHPGETGNS
ncbi:MAG: ribosome biogenesis factor YjgA [Syntrophobacteraceae bacterium]